MKKFFLIIWYAIAAIALSGVIAWFSLFLVWGRFIEVETGFIVAGIVGVLFFIGNTANVLTKEEAPTDIKKSKWYFLKKIYDFIIFLLPFYILSFYFIPKFYEWIGRDVELYKYYSFPCENKTFTINNRAVIYNDTVGLMVKSAYAITHNLLMHDMRNSNVVKKGTKFKVIGFYLTKPKNYTGDYYYLVESLDENKTKVWINNLYFDIEECRPELNKYVEKIFNPKRGTFGEKKIDISNIKNSNP